MHSFSQHYMKTTIDIDIYIDNQFCIFEWQTWLYSTSHLLDVYGEFKVFIFEAFKCISLNKNHTTSLTLPCFPSGRFAVTFGAMIHFELWKLLFLCCFILFYLHIHLIIQAPLTHSFNWRKNPMCPRLPWHSQCFQGLIEFLIFLWLPAEITGMHSNAFFVWSCTEARAPSMPCTRSTHWTTALAHSLIVFEFIASPLFIFIENQFMYT